MQGRRRRVLRDYTTDGDCCTRVQICPVQGSCRDGIDERGTWGKGPAVRDILFFCPCRSNSRDFHILSPSRLVPLDRSSIGFTCYYLFSSSRFVSLPFFLRCTAYTRYPRCRAHDYYPTPMLSVPSLVSCICSLRRFPFRICRLTVLTSMFPPPFPSVVL